MIKILRSQVTGTPPALPSGVLAYSELSRTLFIGLHDGSILAIGGDGLFALKSYVDNAVADAGGGDMLSSVYDANDDGKVNAADDADSLGGQAAGLYALKTYVDAAVAAIVNSAPGVLDTLKELADAIGDDPNFAATLTALVGTKLAKTANLSDLADIAAARGNLGLGTLATQAADAVAITGGTITGVTIDDGTF